MNMCKQGILGEDYEKSMEKDKRKKNGSFYTPDFIVDYIIENTMENIDVIKNPFLKVLDPSCGSGYFLIKIYDFLMKKFKNNIEAIRNSFSDERYSIQMENTVEVISGLEYWQENNLSYHILKNCIYGSDIDSEAVNITRINLITNSGCSIDLSSNIICCNSLIKWEEDYNWKDVVGCSLGKISFKYNDLTGNINNIKLKKEEAYKLINICQFWNERYDYILGNPPWVSLSRRHKKDIENELISYYKNNYSGNSYLPNLYEYFIKRSLQLLENKGRIGFIIPDRLANNLQHADFRREILNNYNILNLTFEVDFPNINTDTMIFIVEKNHRKNNNIKIEVYNKRKYIINQEEYKENLNFKFFYESDSSHRSIKKDIEKNSFLLGDICTTFTGFIGDKKKINHDKVNSEQVKILKGENIRKYDVLNNYYYNFISENIKGGTKNIDKLTCKNKIVIRKTGKRIIAALDKEGNIIEQSLYGIISIKEKISHKYILGILNSKLIQWYYLNFLVTNLNSTPQIKKYSLDRIPIKDCSLKELRRIEDLVDMIISTTKERMILEEELDKSIFDLYGISKVDREIINSSDYV